jgi:hypothetical protein
VLLIAAGLGLLVLGSNWLVDSSVAFARALGVSDLVIGLTITITKINRVTVHGSERDGARTVNWRVTPTLLRAAACPRAGRAAARVTRRRVPRSRPRSARAWPAWRGRRLGSGSTGQ